MEVLEALGMAGAGVLGKRPAKARSAQVAVAKSPVRPEGMGTVEVRDLAKVDLRVAPKATVDAKPGEDVVIQREAARARVVAPSSEDRQAPAVQEARAKLMLQAGVKRVALAAAAVDADVDKWPPPPSRDVEEAWVDRDLDMDLDMEAVGPCTTKAVIQDAARAAAIAVADIHRATGSTRPPAAETTVADKDIRAVAANSRVVKLPPPEDTAGLHATKGAIRNTVKVVAVATAHRAETVRVVRTPAAARSHKLRTAVAAALIRTTVVVARRAVARMTARLVAPLKATKAKATKDAPTMADSARKRRHAS